MANNKVASANVSGYVTHTSPYKYVAYLIEARGPTGVWKVTRRYSEFHSLHKKMLRVYPLSTCPPGADLPPKLTLRSLLPVDGDSLPKMRQAKLGAYLQAILDAKDRVWANSPEVLAFLGVPVDDDSRDLVHAAQSSSNNDSASQIAYAKWLGESKKLSTEISDIAVSKASLAEHARDDALERRIANAQFLLENLESEFEKLQAQEQALLDKGLKHVSNYHLRYIKYTATIQNLRKRLEAFTSQAPSPEPSGRASSASQQSECTAASPPSGPNASESEQPVSAQPDSSGMASSEGKFVL